MAGGEDGDGTGRAPRAQGSSSSSEDEGKETKWGHLTWSRSITEDLMISLHFWSSVSWYFCWDSKSWAHSV